MGIKKIKKENDDLSISVIDSLGLFDISSTKKYTQFLIKMLNLRLNEHLISVQDSYEKNVEKIDDVLPLVNKQNLLVRTLFTDYFGYRNINDFIEFCELMDRGLVDEKDISKYDSWDMMQQEMYKAKNKKYLKNAKKEIKVVYEDEEYLMLKPLTHASSCAYGYNAKWCTSMVNEKEYFYNHSRDGILIYVLNKKTNKKFGFFNRFDRHYEEEQKAFRIFNQEDKEIDSIQTGIPSNLLNVLVMELDTTNPTNLPNYKYFSENEINEMKKYTYINDIHIHEVKHQYEEANVVEELPQLDILRPRFLPITNIRRRYERPTTPALINMDTPIFPIHRGTTDELP